jgi:hypothetical protein
MIGERRPAANVRPRPLCAKRDDGLNCVVVQPSYLPWRGLFHLIKRADVFVFYDDVQYDKHGWRNRNRIKTPNGSQWLSIPVLWKGNVSSSLKINEIRMARTQNWARKHLASLRQSYRKAPFFAQYAPLVESFYVDPPELLADFTIETTKMLAAALGINQTRYLRSSELRVEGSKTERLLNVLRGVGATHYISGPSAKAYIDPAAFEAANISLEYQVYDYPEYEQLYPPYDGQVSVLDLLFMKGSAAPEWIWGSATSPRADEPR